MPFPKNNLPSASMPWGREVEDQIEILKDAVSKNDINSFANTTTNQTNIKNINALLADQLELVTYSKEQVDYSQQYVDFTSTINNYNTKTSNLDITINLNKPRKLLITYSTSCYTQMDLQTTTGSTYYSFNATTLVDDIPIDYENIVIGKQVNTANDFITNQMPLSMTKLVSVSVGYHKISVTMRFYATIPSGSFLHMETNSDNLVVSVIQ